ncbi:MAG: alginate export family protein [Polyangiaceae bacterium]
MLRSFAKGFSRSRVSLAFSASLAMLSTTGVARAGEPWADADPGKPPERTAFGDYGVRPGAEYRANWLYVNPISLNTANDRRASWIEHRVRLDGTIDYQDKVKLVLSTDVLDGVMWGDNGTFTSDPASISGTNVGTKNPNVATPCVGYRKGDPLQASSYGYVLCEAPLFKFRRAYSEITTPVGVIRIGRQAVNVGMGVQNSDGDGRTNRFGFARTGNYTDRILFATKPLEALKPPEQRDRTADRGMVFAIGYDHVVTDAPRLFSDDVHQIFTAIRYLKPEFSGGSDALLSVFYSYRWDGQYNTRINTPGVRAYARFGSLAAGFDAVANLGKTQEIAKAYALLTNDPVVDQTIRQLGARAVVRYDRPTWTAYLEGDFASGDGDPSNRSPLTQFVFAEDTNVGLLMFKHALGFQSARAAAAGVETLRRLGAVTYPAEALNTRGAFTNAVAIFPQVDVRPHRTILVRAGVLAAWAAAPLNDALATLKNRDGVEVKDDLTNFAGGKAARYYGTEIDGRFQWRYAEHFIFDLEGAYLMPGAALQNQDGRAVNSVLVQGRTTVFF